MQQLKVAFSPFIKCWATITSVLVQNIFITPKGPIITCSHSPYFPQHLPTPRQPPESLLSEWILPCLKLHINRIMHM